MIKVKQYLKGNRAIIETKNAKGEPVQAEKNITGIKGLGILGLSAALLAVLSGCSNENSYEPAPTALETPTEESKETPTKAPEVKSTKYDVDKAIDRIVDEDQELGEYRDFLHTDAKDVFKDIKNDDYLRTTIKVTLGVKEINDLTAKEGNFKLPEDGEEKLVASAADWFTAYAEANNIYGKDLVKVYGNHAPTDDEYYDNKTNIFGFVSVYMMNATERLPLHWFVEDKNELNVLNTLQDAIINVNIKERNNTVTQEDKDYVVALQYIMFATNPNIPKSYETLGRAILDGFITRETAKNNGRGIIVSKSVLGVPAGYSLKSTQMVIENSTGEAIPIEEGNVFSMDNQHLEGDVTPDCSEEKGKGKLSSTLSNSLTELRNEISRNFNNKKDALIDDIGKTYADKAKCEELQYADISYFTEDVLNKLRSTYESSVEYIDALERTIEIGKDHFKEICEEIDKLSKVEGKTNDFNAFIKVRRGFDPAKENQNSYSYGGGYGPYSGVPANETSHTREKNGPLTEEEEKIKDDKINEAEQQQEQHNQEVAESANQGSEEIQNLTNATVEQIEQIAEEHGITLYEGAAQNVVNAQQQQDEAEKEKEKIKQEVQHTNEVNAANSAAQQAATEQTQATQQQQNNDYIHAGENVVLPPEDTPKPTNTPKPTKEPDPTNTPKQKPSNTPEPVAVDPDEIPEEPELIPVGGSTLRDNKSVLSGVELRKDTPKALRKVFKVFSGKRSA